VSWTATYYDWLRGLHVASVIFWMAGLLYLPRLFVYHHQAERGGELERALTTQARKLLKIIMNPAMIAAWIFGVLLIFANAARGGGWEMLATPWWAVKIALVIALTGVHMVYARQRRRFEAGGRPWTERAWRMMNEVPALMAVAIVLVATVALR